MLNQKAFVFVITSRDQYAFSSSQVEPIWVTFLLAPENASLLKKTPAKV